MKRRTLPPYTYETAKAYVYKPYRTGDGRSGARPTLRLRDASGALLRPGCPVSAVWEAYERLQGAREQTIGWLLDGYVESEKFLDLKPTTREEYRRQAQFLKRYRLRGGRCLSALHLKAISRGVLRKYLDARKREGAPVGGNREVRLISLAWAWALDRDEIKLPNPGQGLRRNKEQARTRYVTDEEYSAAFDLAGIYRYLRPAMELAYLCRLRQAEVRALRKSDITDKGLDCRRLKGSRDALTLWSDRLRVAIDQALTIPSRIESVYLLHNGDGTPLTKTGFSAAWRRGSEERVSSLSPSTI